MRIPPDQMFVAPAPSAPQKATAVVQGQPGLATWTYWWVVHYPIGAVVSGPITVAHVPTLSAQNFVVIDAEPAEGAIAYDCLRTDSENFPQSPGNFALATGLLTPRWYDQGAAPTYYDPTSLPWGAPASCHLYLNNRDYDRPTLILEPVVLESFPGAGGPGVQLLVPELAFPDGSSQQTAGGGGGGGGQNQSPWLSNINGNGYQLNNAGYIGVGTTSNTTYRISVAGSINVTGGFYVNGVQVPAQGPQGPAGPTGPAGAAATIQVGTVTTLAPGAAATVVNVGTSSAAVFNFGIPQGQPGSGGGGGSQTPWLQNIDAAGFSLLAAGYIDINAQPAQGNELLHLSNAYAPTTITLASSYVNGEANLHFYTPQAEYWLGVDDPNDAYVPNGFYIIDAKQNVPDSFRLVIAQNGNVGIHGQPNPQFALDVAGDINLTGGYFRIDGVPINTGGGGGGSQTPWLQDVDADRWNLLHVGQISVQYLALCSSTYVAELYLDANGSFQFVNGSGTGIAWITQNGRLGVGVQQPGYAVDVAGEVNATGFRINGVPITAGGGSQTPWMSDIDAAGYQVYSLGQVWIGGPPNDTSTPSGGAATSGGAVLDLLTDITHYNLIALGSQTGAWAGCCFLGNYIADTVSVFVTPNNLVGLAGNTSPSYAVDVAGEVNATGFRINGVPITAGGGNQTPWLSDICADGYDLDQCGTAQIEFLMLYSDTHTAQIALDASGNITIPNSVTVAGDVDITGSYRVNGVSITTGGGGSQSPWTSNIDGGGYQLTNAGPIDIHGANPQLTITSATGVNTVFKLVQATTAWTYAVSGTTTPPAGTFYLYNNSANAVVFSVTTAGNVAIRKGYTTASYPLDVTGDINISGSGAAYRINGSLFVTASAGNFGIGMTTPAYKLDVAGNINSTGYTIGAFGWVVNGGNLYFSGDPFGNFMIVNPNLGTIDFFGDVTFHGTVTGVNLAQLESRLSRLEGRMGV